jgi:hypothetical protein
MIDAAPVDGASEQAPNPWAATFLALRSDGASSHAAVSGAHLLKRYERVVVGGAPDTSIAVLGEQLRQHVDAVAAGTSGASFAALKETEEPSAGTRRTRDAVVAETITHLPIRLDTVNACRTIMAAVIHHLDA